jgi:crooked neck
MRRDFEEKLRMQKHHIGSWIKYAEWEATIGEFQRSRSVFERALEVDFQNITLWLKYAEMEMRNQNVNHARNVWDRACKHMPRVD